MDGAEMWLSACVGVGSRKNVGEVSKQANCRLFMLYRAVSAFVWDAIGGWT
jgi:hypothetical protein